MSDVKARLVRINDASVDFRTAAKEYTEAAAYLIDQVTELIDAGVVCPTLVKSFEKVREAASTMKHVNSHSGHELQRALDFSALHIAMFHTQVDKIIDGDEELDTIPEPTNDEVH